MRRTIGFLLIAIGSFALVLGLSMPVYAYPNLALLERGGISHSIAEGRGLTVFDPESAVDPEVPAERHNVDVVANRTVKGLTDAPEAKVDGDVAVWEVGMVIMDRKRNKPISVTEEKLCVNRHTSRAVDPCSSDYVKDPGRSDEHKTFNGPHTGQVYKFPFGTERKNYSYFDSTLRRAPMIRYLKEEQIHGVTVYKFEQVIPRTRIEDREVPGRLLGQPDEDSVVAGRYYENHRVIWVEPETGIIVKGTEEIRQTLENPTTGNSIVLLAGTIKLSDKTVRANAKRAGDGASKLRLLTVTTPVSAGIAGVVIALIGVWLTRRRWEPEHAFIDD
ncbi:MAG: DUF3068 domain-containing protein [Micromonosporaceae bacterium]